LVKSVTILIFNHHFSVQNLSLQTIRRLPWLTTYQWLIFFKKIRINDIKNFKKKNQGSTNALGLFILVVQTRCTIGTRVLTLFCFFFRTSINLKKKIIKLSWVHVLGRKFKELSHITQTIFLFFFILLFLTDIFLNIYFF